MAHYIYSMQGVTKVYPPNKTVLKDIWLSFYYGAKIGVLGLNGAGKSSLLRIMAGEITEHGGEAKLSQNHTVGYLSQEPRLDPAKTVLENIEEGVAPIKALLKRYDEINEKFGEPMDDAAMDKLLAEQARVQDQIEASGAWELDRTLEMAMDALRCPPPDADVTKLSGGEKRRVALCRLLLSSPDLLLLDEPTNHLDAESVAWLERFLKDYKGSVVAVTHDRYFLDNVAGWILELDRGEGIPWEGNYSSWLQQKEARLAQEERQADSRRRTLQRELEWIGLTPKARQAKGKARINEYEKLLAEDAAYQSRTETAELHIPSGPRLGDTVIEAKGVSKGFGDKLLFEGLEFKLPPAGIVGVIGPNGAGKTTLFKMITGAEKPDGGELKIGDTVKLAYVDQSRDALDGEAQVWASISDGLDMITVGGREMPARAYAGLFNFKGQDQQKLVKNLSGGERGRVHLARMLRAGGNVLLLDEPTNDLDVETLRALENAINDFAGCAVIISHDRWFLDRVATHILAFEGDSKVVWFEGNYQDYEADRKKRMGAAADQPHRIKYKPLTRK